MSSATFGSAKGSAFRARRFGAWSLRRLASRYGELPLHALPGAIPATDSAAAPTQAVSKRTARQPVAPRPDPEYESRLEELAQSMLGSVPESGSSLDQGNGAPAAAGKRNAAEAPATAGSSRPARSTRPATAGRPAVAERTITPAVGDREPATVRRSSSTAAPLDFGPDASGRREPVLDSLADGKERRGVTPPPSHRLRNSAIVVAMLTGVAIGIGSAWWFAELDEMDRALASAGASSSGRTGHGGSASGSVEQQAGLKPPVEPPARPQATPEPAAATPKVVSPAPAAVASSADQDEVPDSGVASTAPTEVSKPLVASVDARPAKAKSKEIGKEKGKANSKERSPAQNSKRDPTQTAAAKRSKKPAPVARATPEKSDDDIDRLRSQAYSESSRDREQRVLPKPASPGTAVAVTPISTASSESRISHKKELAQCEKLDGLFYRERCKWRICQDQWGSNGCPSFAPQTVRF